MIALLIVGLITVALAASLGYLFGQSSGFAAGYKDGGVAGHERGFRAGRTHGYDEGYKLGETAGYNTAHDEIEGKSPDTFAGIPTADVKLANDIARRRRGHAPADA